MTVEVELPDTRNETQQPPPQNRKDRMPDWVLIAAILLAGTGVFALAAAIAEFVNPAWNDGLSLLGPGVSASLFGIIDMIIAVAAFYGALEIWRGRKIGYYLGIIFGTVNAARWFLFIPIAPFWALALVAIWGLIISALVRHRDYFE
jgi:hypothetical protein